LTIQFLIQLSDGKTRKKTQAANGQSKGNENILEVAGGSTRSHCVEKTLWPRLWTCRNSDYLIVIMVMTLGLSFKRPAPGDEASRQVEATPTLVPTK